MRRVLITTANLRMIESSRLQCLHGCKNYKRNPLCPPSCPDFEWFQNLIQSYKSAAVYFEVITYIDTYDLIRKKNLFQGAILDEEHDLKKNGNYFALSFVSGACTMCEDKECNLDDCSRTHFGRIPICATGIDLSHMCGELLDIQQETVSTFWKLNLSNNYFEDNNKYFCLALILF